jgi:hypothetical protein
MAHGFGYGQLASQAAASLPSLQGLGHRIAQRRTLSPLRLRRYMSHPTLAPVPAGAAPTRLQGMPRPASVFLLTYGWAHLYAPFSYWASEHVAAQRPNPGTFTTHLSQLHLAAAGPTLMPGAYQAVATHLTTLAKRPCMAGFYPQLRATRLYTSAYLHALLNIEQLNDWRVLKLEREV